MTATLIKPEISRNQRPIDWLPYDFTIIRNHTDIEAKLLAAYVHARVNSPDPSTQLGSVLAITRGKEEFTLLGVNAPSRGLELTPEQLQDRDLKMLAVLHAESASITNAASAGMSTKGSTLVCPWYSCPDCAKILVGAKIGRIVGHLQMFQATPDRWKPAITAGMQILSAGGVDLCLYDGPVGNPDVSVRFNGEQFYPSKVLQIVTT